MNQDLDKIEENLKKKEKQKKAQKMSGRSVFDLQKIIKEKSEKDLKSPRENETT